MRNDKTINVKVCQILRRKIEGAEEEATIDKRGKHKNQVQVGEDIRELVREHLSPTNTFNSTPLQELVVQSKNFGTL